MGHTLQELRQPLRTGTRREPGDALPFGLGCSTDLGASYFASSSRFKRCHARCQPPPCSDLFPDYVTLNKRELFRPSFRLKQYCK